MITIHLNNLHFNSFHGIHEQEKILGNDYLVNASLEFQEHQQVITSISDTVNYADVYNIISERMSVPTPLLETVVMEIGKEIHREFPEVRSINISLQKMRPPIEGMQGAAGVTWEKKY